MPYKNIMEMLVEREYELLKDSLHCCDCPQCREDIFAYALNQLPAHYVVEHSGAKISEALQGAPQNATDIRIALCKAAELVAKHPRHPL